MLTDQELRVYALETAIRTEGPKAVVEEVIAAAEAIYDFLMNQESVPAPLPN
jgi:hypothetical protein